MFYIILCGAYKLNHTVLYNNTELNWNVWSAHNVYMYYMEQLMTFSRKAQNWKFSIYVVLDEVWHVHVIITNAPSLPVYMYIHVGSLIVQWIALREGRRNVRLNWAVLDWSTSILGTESSPLSLVRVKHSSAKPSARHWITCYLNPLELEGW